VYAENRFYYVTTVCAYGRKFPSYHDGELFSYEHSQNHAKLLLKHASKNTFCNTSKLSEKQKKKTKDEKPEPFLRIKALKSFRKLLKMFLKLESWFNL
jgi:hypothetical protein